MAAADGDRRQIAVRAPLEQRLRTLEPQNPGELSRSEADLGTEAVEQVPTGPPHVLGDRRDPGGAAGSDEVTPGAADLGGCLRSCSQRPEEHLIEHTEALGPCARLGQAFRQFGGASPQADEIEHPVSERGRRHPKQRAGAKRFQLGDDAAAVAVIAQGDETRCIGPRSRASPVPASSARFRSPAPSGHDGTCVRDRRVRTASAG